MLNPGAPLLEINGLLGHEKLSTAAQYARLVLGGCAACLRRRTRTIGQPDLGLHRTRALTQQLHGERISLKVQHGIRQPPAARDPRPKRPVPSEMSVAFSSDVK